LYPTCPDARLLLLADADPDADVEPEADDDYDPFDGRQFEVSVSQLAKIEGNIFC
jgi:hypothetical protein